MSISCLLELCAEVPAFVGQVFCFIKLKIIIDTFHILVRSFIFIMIVLNNSNVTIYAFGIAQFSSVLTIIVGYYLFFHIYISNFKKYRSDIKIKNENQIIQEYGNRFKNMEDFKFNSVFEFFPGVLKNEDSVFDSELQVLVLSFFKQGIFKQVLTEGEKYVMSLSPVLTFSEQATYDIVNNLGSLAARFILRPIEDSSYFYFTQTISRDNNLVEQNKKNINEAGDVLKKLLRTVTFIGLLALIFGQSYSKTFLILYGGNHFVEDNLPEILLRCHCLAILLLAINGITEGFMFATNTSIQIDSYNYYMAIFSAIFLILSYQLTNLFGSIGFIFANCCNMLLRIIYSTNYIQKQFKFTNINPLAGLLPSTFLLTTLLIMGIISKISEQYIFSHSIVCHIGVGIACVTLVLIVAAIENRDILQIGIDKYKRKNHID